MHSSKNPQLIAHRGYASAYPENTLPALAAAVKAGAHYLECDVQLSSDLVPVLFHDLTLKRQCRQPGMIRDYTLARLQEFSAGCPERFGDRFAEVRIATLKELVELLRHHPGVIPFIELKKNSLIHFGSELVLDIVLEQLREVRQRAVPISYEIGALQAARRRGWQAVGAVLDSWDQVRRPELTDLAPAYIFCAVEGLPANGALGFPGARLAVFEVEAPEVALALAGRGVELIETFALVEMQKGLERTGKP
jgi:glycerophosphoryl diester phosphodiesterase